MTGIVARIGHKVARCGFAVLFGALLTSVVSGEALARHHSGHLHARLHVHHGFAGSHFAGSHAELVAPQPSQLGAMRYYGGPKSPMWRAPAEEGASQARAQEQQVQQHPTQLGPMRYYGGPKSPMWRGPVEN